MVTIETDDKCVGTLAEDIEAAALAAGDALKDGATYVCITPTWREGQPVMRYHVVTIDTLGKERLIDTFVSLTNALAYADALNRDNDNAICYVRHEEVKS